MVIKRELERAGERVLVETQFIGVSGQLCSVVYEVTGPIPEYFTDFGVARQALRSAGPGEGDVLTL